MNRVPTPAVRTAARSLLVAAALSFFMIWSAVACASSEWASKPDTASRFGDTSASANAAAGPVDYLQAPPGNSGTTTQSDTDRMEFAGLMSGAGGDDTPPPGPGEQPVRRVVVYKSHLDLVVDKTDEAADLLTALVEEFDGYVQTMSAERLTVRIPAASFAAFIKRLGSVGSVANEQREAIDVTEEYVDLLARLKSATTVQARLRALLERAEDVKAALAVEQELKRVDEQVERLKGQIAVLNNRIAFSTIAIRLLTVARPDPVQVAEGFGELPFEWLRQLNPTRLWR